MQDNERKQVRTRADEQKQETIRTNVNENVSTGSCPYCGAHVEADYEICPVCGHKLVGYCTFCGAPMSPTDIDCPECGMPAEGVMCPDCGVRNFRPFCRKCGLPLSRAARKAVEKAKQDPKVLEAARLLERISSLKAELDGAAPGDEAPQEPSESERRLMELMSKVGFSAAEQPKAKERRIGRTREEVLAEYQKAVEDANRVFEEMLPPAGSTPQEQRNYHTARKVAVTEIIEKTWYGIVRGDVMCWECNRCHVLHNNPSECSVREFGGKWIECSRTDIVPEGTPGARKFTEKVGERIVYKREE